MRTLEERGIFSYVHPETGEAVYADPIFLDMRMRKASAEEDMDVVFSRIESPVEDLYEEGVTRLLPILYRTFDLQPVDPKTGEGVASEDVLDLYRLFMDFKDTVKKNTDMSPSGTPPSPDLPAGSGTDGGPATPTEQPKEEPPGD